MVIIFFGILVKLNFNVIFFFFDIDIFVVICNKVFCFDKFFINILVVLLSMLLLIFLWNGIWGNLCRVL